MPRRSGSSSLVVGVDRRRDDRRSREHLALAGGRERRGAQPRAASSARVFRARRRPANCATERRRTAASDGIVGGVGRRRATRAGDRRATAHSRRRGRAPSGSRTRPRRRPRCGCAATVPDGAARARGADARGGTSRRAGARRLRTATRPASRRRRRRDSRCTSRGCRAPPGSPAQVFARALAGGELLELRDVGLALEREREHVVVERARAGRRRRAATTSG